MDDVTRQGENGPHVAVVGTGPESIFYDISRNRNVSCQQGAERPHVAVVGAGAAGLAAARQLLNAGARVTIFEVPLGPLGFNFSQNSSTTRPSIERTGEKAFCFQIAFSSPVQRLK